MLVGPDAQSLIKSGERYPGQELEETQNFFVIKIKFYFWWFWKALRKLGVRFPHQPLSHGVVAARGALRNSMIN